MLFSRIESAPIKYDNRSPPSISSKTSNVWSPSRQNPIIQSPLILQLFLLVDGSMLFPRIASAHLKYDRRSPPSISSKTSNVWSLSRQSHTNVNSLYTKLPYFNYFYSLMGACFFPEFKVLTSNTTADLHPPSVPKRAMSGHRRDRVQSSGHHYFFNYFYSLKGPCFFP